MEEYTPETQEASTEDLKRWFQDNLRIVISIAIVVVIAGGIYSYSKRGETPIVADQTSQNAASDTASAPAATDGASTATTTDTAASAATTQSQVAATPTSQETETSFVETAAKGDSMTLLARKATADYLVKNPDSSLTKEHKIYIEDYLRKSVAHTGGVHIGSSVEFSKTLIQNAIAQSKTLSTRQLQNLQKYSARVPSLS